VKTIAVVIPCLNEVKTIGKVISDFRNELPEADIFVIDNDSTDGTASKALEAGANHEKGISLDRGRHLRHGRW